MSLFASLASACDDGVGDGGVFLLHRCSGTVVVGFVASWRVDRARASLGIGR